MKGRGPEVEITCDECRTKFDAEPAICATCLQKQKTEVEKRDARISDLNEEIAALQEDLDAARAALETMIEKNDELHGIVNRLHEMVYPRSAS